MEIEKEKKREREREKERGRERKRQRRTSMMSKDIESKELQRVKCFPGVEIA